MGGILSMPIANSVKIFSFIYYYYCCKEAHIHVMPQRGLNQILLVLVYRWFSNMQGSF